jgi:Protein of unknown function (DUF2800)
LKNHTTPPPTTPAPVLHHPFGASALEGYDPKSGGCYALIPRDSFHEKAQEGTNQHSALYSGDFSILEGNPELEKEVRETEAYFLSLIVAGNYSGETLREITLELPGVNFGTFDLLQFNQAKTRAFIGDAKFGAWSVTPATRNLQLKNYVAYVFENYPSVQHVKASIYQAKHRKGTVVNYTRASFPKLVARIRTIVENATRAAKTPVRGDFTPDPVNCGFCSRVNCPARIELCSTLVSAWQKKPVVLPSLNFIELSNDQIADLKKLGNAIKSFISSVDDEAKRRVIDEGATIPGYELTSRASKRIIVGVEKINQSQKVMLSAWKKAYPSVPLDVGAIVSEHCELAVGDIEELVGQVCPKGEKTRGQKLISEALNEAKLIDAPPMFYLAQIKK